MGGLLLVQAMGQAADIRDQKDAVGGRGGASVSEAAAIESDESDAQFKHTVSVSLLGAGALLGAYAVYLWNRDDESAKSVHLSMSPRGMAVRW